MFAIGIVAIGLVLTPFTATPPPIGFQSHSPIYRVADTAGWEDGFYVRQSNDSSGAISAGESILTALGMLDCRPDEMSDKKDCKIESKVGGPVIYYHQTSAPVWVCIIGHDFPGKTGMVRVDANSPVPTDDQGCVGANQILDQMLSGQVFKARRVEWPDEYPIDTKTSLAGLRKALELARRLLAER
ncbi:hypothetical protein [Mesorhizobium sp. B4-1-4]|uniref:hypothetical protein n=1 Tax=Mesorhizobium sp. B4-1-4 TaxID=2589888 RepID=UPI00112BCF1D|nr:hypothetical protein [Mesorhizobium sp. B4-1-4]UCI30799.1 hypothetical protein FJW03_23875 [Mesorhizobium sp. B4-1-4]